MGLLVVMEVLSESKEPVDLERLYVEVVGEVGGRNILALRVVVEIVGSEKWYSPGRWNWDWYAIPYRCRVGAVSVVVDGRWTWIGSSRSQTRLRTVDLHDGGYNAGSQAQAYGSRSPAACRRIEPQHSM